MDLRSLFRRGTPPPKGGTDPLPADSTDGQAPATGRDGDMFRVLMVDDEELICKLATGMAQRLQLDFTAVATASAALAVAGASRIDVLVADVLLGEDTTGIELAKQLVARQPGLSLVLMSGYTADHFDLSGLPEHTQFLTKPFTTDALTHCLAVARNRSASPEG